MSLRRKFRNSLVLQTGLSLLSMLAIVLGAGLLILYLFVWHLLHESVNQNAVLVCQEKVNQFDQAFFQVEDYANMLSSTLAATPRENWGKVIRTASKDLAATGRGNVNLIGAAYLPETGQDGKILLIQVSYDSLYTEPDCYNFPSQEGQDYGDESWYTEVLSSGKGQWNEPMLGVYSKDLVAMYSRPIFQVLPEGKSKIIGVVCIDMGVQWIDSTLRELRLPYSGKFFLFSQRMQMLSMPEKHLIGKNFLDEAPKSYFNTYHGIATGIKHVVERKHSGQFTLHDLTTKEPFRLVLCPMKSTGWSLGILFYESQLGAPLRFFRFGIIIIALLSAGIVLFFILRTGRNIACLLNDVKHFSREIGRGNLTAPIPSRAWKGEFRAMLASIDRMRRSLATYIESVRRATEQNERITSELQIAQRIQYGLLPDISHSSFLSDYFEASAKLLPAKEIGGDFYDCTMVEPGLLGFVIGDVSGKGIPAALFMVFAQVGQRVLRGDSKLPPNLLVDKMNRLLFAQNGERLFVTFLGGFINAETGMVHFCNAGHLPFFILKNDGTLQDSGPRNGLPLGLKKENEYSEAQCQLEPGETIVLFTDGITDAEDPDGNFFGMERFRTLLRECAGKNLAAGEIEHRIMQTVCDFSRVNDRSDDIACLAIRYRQASHTPHLK